MTFRAFLTAAAVGVLLAGCASHSASSVPAIQSAANSYSRPAAMHSVATAATESTLYEFPYPSHGCWPNAPFFVGEDSHHIVGSARCGGTGYDGVIYVLTPRAAGYSEHVVFRFPVSGPLGDQPGPIMRDSLGNLIGVSSAGIFEISHTGTGWQGTLVQACPATKEFANLNGAVSQSGTTLYAACGQGVYRLQQSGSGYTSTLLYTFAGSAGIPQNNLTVLRSGALFGTTYGGGTNNTGSVFKLTPSTSGYNMRVLHSFGPVNGSDGYNPGPGMFMDSSGAFYGITTDGGGDARGVLYKMIPNKLGVQGYKYFLIFDALTASPDESYPSGKPFGDSSGNIYFTAIGDYPTHGGVFELSPAFGEGYSFTRLYDFQQTDASFPIGLFTDASGALYGALQRGGHCIYASSPGCGGIFKVTH